MCSTPDINPPAPISPPQAAKAPDLDIHGQRKKLVQAGRIGIAGMGASATGTAGVPTSALNLGGVQLLGGK